jgi:hypothetical protein
LPLCGKGHDSPEPPEQENTNSSILDFGFWMEQSLLCVGFGVAIDTFTLAKSGLTAPIVIVLVSIRLA